MRTRGFSLVELSIVLVILGLLVGGILAGQSLIRASELRAVTSESQRYITAIHAFRDKYFALPGDMANATSFWGKDATTCNSHSGTAAIPGTCNGNGDGQATYSSEAFRGWQHLANAGFVEGTYTGLTGSGSSYDHVFGRNSPASKFPGAGWSLTYIDNTSGSNSNTFALNYLNWLTIGTEDGIYADDDVFTPEEAWNIDTKFDDGMPGKGRVHGRSRMYCVVTQGDTATAYKLFYTRDACAVFFNAQ